jgi:hypothetical protein
VRLQALLNRGLSFKAVAERLGCRRCKVVSYVRRLKLPRPAGALSALRLAAYHKCMRLNDTASLAEVRVVRRRVQALYAGWPEADTPVEAAILQTLWEIKVQTQPDLCTRVRIGDRPLSRTYIRAILRRLVDRGLIRIVGTTGGSNAFNRYSLAENVMHVTARPRETRRGRLL